MLEQQSDFLIVVFEWVFLAVFFTSMFSMMIIGPWYFISLRKLVVVAKDVDPKAWADWGCPKSPWDMGYRRQYLFLRAVFRRKGINAALQAHPTYQLAHRLCWVSLAIIGLLFAVTLIGAGLHRLGYLGDPWV